MHPQTRFNPGPRLLALAAASLLLLPACGGGGGSSPASTNPSPESKPTEPSAVSPWKGVKQFGMPGADTWAKATAVDRSGYVYVAGYTEGNLDNNTLTGTRDAFLTKYDPSGNKLFTRLLGAPGAMTEGYSLAAAKDGNVYLTGYTKGGLDSNALTGTKDVFLAKYDSLGNKLFVKQFGAAGADTAGNATTIAPDGSVWITGYTKGALDGNALTGTCDAFLSRIDSSGQSRHTFLRGVKDAETIGWGIATGLDGSIHLAGQTNGSLDGQVLTGTIDAFLTRFNADGSRPYTRLLGAKGQMSRGYSVVVDGEGNAYLAGDTWGDLDGHRLNSTDACDAFLAKYDKDGDKVFTQTLGYPNSMDRPTFPGYRGSSLALDAAGGIYMVGCTSGSLDGQSPEKTAYVYDLFLAKFDGYNKGTKLFVRQLGDPDPDKMTWGMALAQGPDGGLLVVGQTDSSLGGKLTGKSDAFIAKYDGNGVLK